MSTNTPSQVFAEVVNNLQREALKSLPNENTVKRTLRNCKGRMYPKNPQNLSELSITGDWTLYKNKRFLLYDSGPDSDERVIIFSLDDGLRYITDANNWFCDGNFSLSPDHFFTTICYKSKKKRRVCDRCLLFIRKKNKKYL